MLRGIWWCCEERGRSGERKGLLVAFRVMRTSRTLIVTSGPAVVPGCRVGAALEEEPCRIDTILHAWCSGFDSFSSWAVMSAPYSISRTEYTKLVSVHVRQIKVG